MPVLIVVRRGAADRFRFLREQFAEEAVEVIWDRRVAERRRRGQPISIERRVWERRESFEEEPAWNRRVAERREWVELRMPERRQGDRRHSPPSSWGALDFIVAGEPNS